MSYQLIIFDLDGTLVDTAADVHFSMNQFRSEIGLPPISQEEAKESIGPGPDRFAKLLTKEDSSNNLKKNVNRFREIYSQHLLDTTRLFSGIERVLKEISEQKIHLVVATNKPRRFSLQIVAGLNIDRYFDAVLGPDDVEKQKPAPDVILKAMQITGIESAKTLMIGDTKYDIQAAQSVGVDVCAAGYGYTPLAVLTSLSPKFVVQNPDEILSIVNGEYVWKVK